MATTTPFAYNPSLSPISGTTQVGTLAVGTTNQNYSKNPGGVKWWMGPDESLGYVVCAPVPGNTQPTPIPGVFASVEFYMSENLTDISFINLAETVSILNNTPQTFSTAASASDWLTNNGFWNSYISPILYLDAGNPASYPGSGTTWTDISGNGYNYTLIGDVIFDSGSDGSLNFTNDSYANSPNFGSTFFNDFTYEVWINPTTNSGVILNETDGNPIVLWSVSLMELVNGEMRIGGWVGSVSYIGIGTINTGSWYQIVMKYSVTTNTLSGYVNGELINSASGFYKQNPISGYYGIAHSQLTNFGNGGFYNGKISVVKFYNTTLTDTEILQNYNALKSRYGFIMTLNIPSNNYTVVMPYENSFTYTGTIDWGDGNTSANAYGAQNIYTTAGLYTITVNGEIGSFNTQGVPSIGNVLTSITQFGNQFSFGFDIGGYFFECTQLTSLASDIPLNGITNMDHMFQNASLFNQNINSWDVSNVTSMAYMFYGTQAFNQPLSGWNVSNVTSMYAMFHDSKFNQNINSWNVSNVTNMEVMFKNTSMFDQPLSGWNVSNVLYMGQMFYNSKFNQNINLWNVSNVRTMIGMFQNAIFDQPLSEWNVSNVLNMDDMFNGASLFNQDLSHWCVTNIPSKPTNFDNGATSWILPEPVWGTCPS